MKSDTPVDVGRPLGALLDLVRDVRLAWQLFFDRRVPIWTKGIPLLSVAYLVWPLDLLPDPILGLGQLDDVAIILLGIKLFVTLCPGDLVQQHLQRLAGVVKPTTSADDKVVDANYRVLDDDKPH
jgi:uncharacterized membrane protein YkvA (DUF1232 family)